MNLEVAEYAYMFGFIQMDGHMARTSPFKGRLSVELSHHDRCILEAFQRLTPYPSTIRERTRTTNFADAYRSVLWTLCAYEARSRLEDLGLPYGAKSSIVKPPCVPFSEPDYLRGLVDADGSLGYTAAGLPFLSLTSASEAVINFLCHYASSLTGAHRTPRRNARDDIFNVVYTNETAVALMQSLYYDGCLGLERKKAAAMKARRWVRPPGMRPPQLGRRNWTSQEDHILANSRDLETAAQRLGRSVQACKMRRWRIASNRAGSWAQRNAHAAPAVDTSGETTVARPT